MNADPTSLRRWLLRLYTWTADGFAVFLLAALGAATLVAGAVLGRGLLAQPVALMLGGGLYVVIAFALLGLAWRDGGRPTDRTLLWSITLLVLLVRGTLMLAIPAYEQAGDCRFMLDTIRMLARDGMGEAVMRHLAGIYYDDYLWVGRSLPYLLPLAKLWPGHEVETARLANLVWSALMSLMVYDLTRRLFDRRVARLAFVLITIIPVHTWMMLDYTHQFFGAFLVFSGVYVLIRQALAEPGSWSGSVGRGVLLGLILIGLNLQSGLDRFVILLAALLFMLVVMAQGWRKARAGRWLVLLVLALALYGVVAGLFTRWLMQYRPLRMSSHPISFTARGWNLVTGGEYYGVYEQIDRVTPWPEKPEAMQGLILSQMTYQPVATLIKLPVIKATKYFLVGYATSIAQQLQEAASSRWVAAFNATRLVFTPLFVLLCGLGVWSAVGRRQQSPAQVMVWAAPAVFCLVYLAAGETSPRYSFHIHGFLAILAARGWVTRGTSEVPLGSRLGRLGVWAGLAAVGLGLAVLILPGLIRQATATKLFVDMRDAQSLDGVAIAPDSTVFTRVLHLPGAVVTSTVQQTVSMPVSAGDRELSLFVWPLAEAPVREQARWDLMLDGAPVRSGALSELAYVQRLAIPLPGSPSGAMVRVDLRISDLPPGHGSDEPLLRWGYLKRVQSP